MVAKSTTKNITQSGHPRALSKMRNRLQNEVNETDRTHLDSPKVDINAISLLRNSIDRVGLLNHVLVCKQHRDRILGGIHRIGAAGGIEKLDRKEVDVDEISKSLDVSHDIGEMIVKIHSNVQRRASREETQSLVLSIAAALETSTAQKETIG